MAGVRIRTEGVRITARNLDRMADQVGNVDFILDAFEDSVSVSNTRITPRRTGRLRRSLRLRRRGRTSTAQWTAPYAVFVNARGRSAGFITRIAEQAQRDVRAVRGRQRRGGVSLDAERSGRTGRVRPSRRRR